MSLPHTSALALQAPLPLPADLDGFMWCESFDKEGAELPVSRHSLAPVRESLRRLLLLLESCGWLTHRVFVLGYMQGGQVALDLAMHLGARLGGVVSLCGYLDAVYTQQAELTLHSPTLVVAGDSNHQASRAQAADCVNRLRSVAKNGVQVRMSKLRGRAIRSEQEMRPVMDFFAENLDIPCAALENDPSIIRVS